MIWFKTVFLPSLIERAKAAGHNIWLTEKQTNIIVRYMNPGNFQGQYIFNFDGIVCYAHVSPKNHRASFYFTPTT